MAHIKLMNRNSVRLLDETNEEFEFKILQHILYELQDKYVIYKQIEFYTKPLEK
jgi:two-component SAPR family response regulator